MRTITPESLSELHSALGLCVSVGMLYIGNNTEEEQRQIQTAALYFVYNYFLKKYIGDEKGLRLSLSNLIMGAYTCAKFPPSFFNKAILSQGLVGTSEIVAETTEGQAVLQVLM